MTYDSLVADVITYSERNDAGFIAQIPRLIMMTEQNIASQIKTLMQLVVVDTTLTTGDAVLEKPVRWRKTISMKVNGAPIVQRSMDYITQYQSESDNGLPLYYAEYDYDHWALAPVPDSNYPVEIIYYSRIQPLDQQNQENLLTREAPQALLYGTLLQAQGYLKSLDKIPVWKQYYDDAISALTGEDAKRKTDRNTNRQDS